MPAENEGQVRDTGSFVAQNELSTQNPEPICLRQDANKRRGLAQLSPARVVGCDYIHQLLNRQTGEQASPCVEVCLRPALLLPPIEVG